MSNKTLIFTLISGLSLSGTALAEDAILTFDEMDSDANGYITSNEASKDIREHFSQIDSDSNGNITITEFQNYMGRNRMTPPEEMETPEPGAAPY